MNLVDNESEEEEEVWSLEVCNAGDVMKEQSN